MKQTTVAQLTQWRRALHQIPELSLEEFQTAAYIREQLQQMGIPFVTPMPTATVVVLSGQSQDAILLRADIDALPIAEQTQAPFASQHPGKMHACGHDGHTAMLLGALQELYALQQQGELQQSVVAVFQPAEESFGGANLLIQQYDFSQHHIRAAYALHVNPDYPAGTLAMRVGPLMARCCEFQIQVTGQAAHVGVRERGVNALQAAVHIFQQCQALPTYNLSSQHTNIVHVGTIHAGDAVNIVPAHATLAGTIRTYDDADFATIQERLQHICAGVGQATGCEVTITFAVSYPPVINDADCTQRAQAAAATIQAPVVMREQPYLLGEDFSFFAQVAPLNFSFLGIRDDDKGYTSGLHTSTLQFDEHVLAVGVDYFVALVQRG